jgi:hypothetical protein
LGHNAVRRDRPLACRHPPPRDYSDTAAGDVLPMRRTADGSRGIQARRFVIRRRDDALAIRENAALLNIGASPTS